MLCCEGMGKPAVSSNPNKKIYQVDIHFVVDARTCSEAEEYLGQEVVLRNDYLMELYSVTGEETQQEGIATIATVWIAADYHSSEEAAWAAEQVGEANDSAGMQYKFAEEPQVIEGQIEDFVYAFSLDTKRIEWIQDRPGVFQDFIAYHRLYGTPMEGHSRVAYMDYENKCVYKIPYTDKGIRDNRLEAKTSLLYEQGDKEVIPVARCSTFAGPSDLPYLKMEMLDRDAAWQQYGSSKNMPEWAGNIIETQVGIDSRGQLVAFDFS